MVADALRGYLQLASGLTEVTRERAREAAAALAAQIDAVTGQAQARALADDLLTTARTNRDHVMALVRAEVEQALGNLGSFLTPETVAGLGLATAADVSELQKQVTDLAAKLASAEAAAKKATPASTSATSATSAATRAATKTTAKKATAKKTTAKTTTAKKTAVKKAVSTSAAKKPTHKPANKPARKPATKPASKKASETR